MNEYYFFPFAHFQDKKKKKFFFIFALFLLIPINYYECFFFGCLLPLINSVDLWFVSFCFWNIYHFTISVEACRSMAKIKEPSKIKKNFKDKNKLQEISNRFTIPVELIFPKKNHPSLIDKLQPVRRNYLQQNTSDCITFDICEPCFYFNRS